MTPLSIAFVLPYGEPNDAFFADTLLGLLCADARRAGHDARMLRVYYDGRAPERDREVRRRFELWLSEHDADLVVVERLFDPEPLRARTVLQVTRGDSLDPAEAVDFVIGNAPGLARTGATRRAPSIAELRATVAAFVARFAEGTPPPAGTVELAPGPHPAGPFDPVLEHDVVCLEAPPKIIRKTLLGNVGCPFAADPLQNPHYANLELPASLPIARLGCSFCHMGGDYEKRPDTDVVADLVQQARYFESRLPELEELVLSDQHALRYLAALMESAGNAGMRRMRWLFPARADAFVRERERIEAAVKAAERAGQVLEIYLSGFEAFSDRELERYNKGSSVADLLAAVHAMRSLASAHSRSFEYARARGHSLVLWNPWTAPEDVRQSVETIRNEGLGELFHEIGRNRLRLYADIPIHYAAQRDGALAHDWEDGDEGAGRRKGYNVERPWRFLDARTRLAHELARALRERLGPETEVGQLRAVVEMAERAVPELGLSEARDRVLSGVDALAAALDALLVDERRPKELARGRFERAEPVHFAGACNNGCEACPNRDAWLADDRDSVAARVDAARTAALPVFLAGREPSVHGAFVNLVARASGHDRRRVGVVTNGRRFAYPAFALAAVRAGLSAASVKLFAAGAADADAISRDPGGHEQALDGIRALRSAGIALELRAPLHARNLRSVDRYPALAKRLGIDQIRVEAALDAVGLDNAGEAARAVERLAGACLGEGVALEASALSAGTRDFRRMPKR